MVRIILIVGIVIAFWLGHRMGFERKTAADISECQKVLDEYRIEMKCPRRVVVFNCPKSSSFEYPR